MKTHISKLTLILFLSIISVISLPQVTEASSCSVVDGASIFGYDGSKWIFIGAIANEFSSLSIANEFGAGSEFKSTSINNEFGRYGGQFGSYSAFNDFASKPPIIVNSNFELIGYLTTNSYKTNALNPYSAIYCAQQSFRSADRSMQDVTFTDSQVSGSSYSSVPVTFDMLEELSKDDDTYKNIRNGFQVNGYTYCEDGYHEDGGKCVEPKSAKLNDTHNSMSDPVKNARVRFVESLKNGRYANIEDLSDKELESYSDEILENVPTDKIKEYAPEWFVKKYVKETSVSQDANREALLKQIQDLLALIAVLQAQMQARTN